MSLHRINGSYRQTLPLLCSLQGLAEDNPYTHAFSPEEHLLPSYSLGRTLGLCTPTRGLWGRARASAEVENNQPCLANQLQSWGNDPPEPGHTGLIPREWDKSQGNQWTLMSQNLFMEKLRQMTLKDFQCREWWMRSVVAAAAAAVTIITIYKESLFLRNNCFWNVSLAGARSTAFPERGIFLTPCALGYQGSERHGVPCPVDQQQRRNYSPGILFPGAALTSTSPVRGREYHQPAAEDKNVTSPIDENLSSPGFWNK